ASLWPVAGLCGRATRVEPTHLSVQPLGGREVEPRQGGAAEAGRATELDEPGDAHRPHGSLRLHADDLPNLEALLGRRRRIDDDLVVLRPGALRELERVELRPGRGDGEAEGRRRA